MTLRQRTLITLGLLPIALIAALHYASQAVLLRSFIDVEADAARRDMERALASLDDTIAAVDATASDYATWDETCAFVAHPNPRYVADCFPDSAFDRFRLNVVLILDTGGRFVYTKAYNLRGRTETPLPAGLAGHFGKGSPFVSHPDLARGAGGLVELPGGVMMLAARPILTSAGRGPARGTLAMGRFLDTSEVARLSGLVRLPLFLQRFSDPQLDDTLRAALSASPAPRDPLVRATGEKSLVCCALLNDVYGKPCVVVRGNLARRIYRQGRAGIDYFTLSLVAVCLLLGAVTWGILSRGVLRPLERLGDAVDAVRASGKPAARMPVCGSDELSRLARTMNEMLSSLERYQGELQGSAEKYRRLFSEALTGNYVADPDGRILLCNPSFARMFAFDSVEEALHCSMAALHPDPGVWHDEVELMRSGVARDAVERGMARRDGERIVVLHAMVPVLGDDGSLAQVQGYLLDITSRKRAEEALQLDEWRLEALVRLNRMAHQPLEEITHFTLEEAVRLTRSRIGYVAFVSEDESVLTMHAWSKQALQECAIPVPPLTYRVAETGLWGEAVRQRRPVITNDYARANPAKKGMPPGHVPLQRHMNVPIFDGERIVVVVGVGNKPEDYDDSDARQLTLLAGEMWRILQLSRLDEQMRHAQKLESLGVLAGGIAHDFNNLLAGILGNAGLAMMKMPPSAPAREYLTRIETIALRAAELTNQMLAYSGKGQFVVEPIDLSRLVAEMADLLQTVVSKKAVLDTKLAPGLPLIEGDASQMRQVVMNLITNASDALGDGSGTIRVLTRVLHVSRATLAQTHLRNELPDGPCVAIEVSDDGCGMDDQTQARIFDPFYTTKFTGRGLGMAAVLGIVRGHHGAIRVQSEPGKGTTIEVLFPIMPAPTPAPPPGPAPAPPAADQWRGTGTILVVDDEESVRSVVAMALSRSGFDVLTAPDGQAAVQMVAARDGEISAVLLDMTMPNMSGEEALAEIHRIRPALPVLLTSGYSEQETRSRVTNGHVAGFIQKPYRPTQLIEKIREALQPAPAAASREDTAVAKGI